MHLFGVASATVKASAMDVPSGEAQERSRTLSSKQSQPRVTSDVGQLQESQQGGFGREQRAGSQWLWTRSSQEGV